MRGDFAFVLDYSELGMAVYQISDDWYPAINSMECRKCLFLSMRGKATRTNPITVPWSKWFNAWRISCDQRQENTSTFNRDLYVWPNHSNQQNVVHSWWTIDRKVEKGRSTSLDEKNNVSACQSQVSLWFPSVNISDQIPIVDLVTELPESWE